MGSGQGWSLFFRPTPYGFRQVVQHVSKHVAYETTLELFHIYGCKLATMMNSSQPQANVFFQPDNLGALSHLWLQAKLTISPTSVQEKFARLFMTIASELWLRGVIDSRNHFGSRLYRLKPRGYWVT